MLLLARGREESAMCELRLLCTLWGSSSNSCAGCRVRYELPGAAEKGLVTGASQRQLAASRPHFQARRPCAPLQSHVQLRHSTN